MRRLHSECRVPEADVSLLGAGCPVRCGVRQRRRRVHSGDTERVSVSRFMKISREPSEAEAPRGGGPRRSFIRDCRSPSRMQHTAVCSIHSNQHGAGGMGRMLAASV